LEITESGVKAPSDIPLCEGAAKRFASYSLERNASDWTLAEVRILARYCQQEEYIQQAHAQLLTEPMVVTMNGGKTSAPNPLIKIIKTAETTMMQQYRMLGLGSSAVESRRLNVSGRTDEAVETHERGETDSDWIAKEFELIRGNKP
jgi:phage terminase small subunit